MFCVTISHSIKWMKTKIVGNVLRTLCELTWTSKAVMIAANFEIPIHINQRRVCVRLRCQRARKYYQDYLQPCRWVWLAAMEWWEERNLIRLVPDVNELPCHIMPSETYDIYILTKRKAGRGASMAGNRECFVVNILALSLVWVIWTPLRSNIATRW